MYRSITASNPGCTFRLKIRLLMCGKTYAGGMFPALRTVVPALRTFIPALRTVVRASRTLVPALRTVVRTPRTVVPASRTVVRTPRTVVPASRTVVLTSRTRGRVARGGTRKLRAKARRRIFTLISFCFLTQHQRQRQSKGQSL